MAKHPHSFFAKNGEEAGCSVISTLKRITREVQYHI